MKTVFIIRLILYKSLFLLALNSLKAQQTAQKFVVETGYLLALPDHYNDDTIKKWPLLLFLHGSGESGSDIEKVKVHGPPQLIELGKKFPFIVVSPQANVPGEWDTENLYNLLQYAKKTYRIDDKKIYLSGLSMGGFGTWALAIKHPEEFAAIAPLCGGGDSSGAWKIRNIPVWCFHGALDQSVPVTADKNMVEAASRYNRNVRFTIYPDKYHNCWDTTYSNDSLYLWMLTQSKFMYKEVAVNISILKKYEGLYTSSDNDTVNILVTIQGLVAKRGKEMIPLKSAAENLFFFRPDRNMDIRFIQKEKGTIGFIFFGDRKLIYRKLGSDIF